MDLCSSCKQFDIQRFSHPYFRWRRRLDSLVAASAAGCLTCSLVLEGLAGTAVVYEGDSKYTPPMEDPLANSTRSWITLEVDGPDRAAHRQLRIQTLNLELSSKSSDLGTPALGWHRSCAFHVAADEGKRPHNLLHTIRTAAWDLTILRSTANP